jgi:hypothetical protein
MNTRRNFLVRGSMATTALLIAKPFKSLANTLAPITGYSISDNKIVLVHTGDHNKSFQQDAIQQIAGLKRNTGNLLLLHAGKENEGITTRLNYDALYKADECVSITNSNYRIIYKGDIKIGIITAVTGQKATVKNINTLSAFLKKEKNCQVVVCLSHLGFKNKTTVDDLKLASRSNNIDIIIGGRADNFTANPVIAQNSKKAEVIIHADGGNGFAFGNIEIDFDEKRNKKSVAINDLTARRETTA